ncbi:MAG: MerR family transcriptional regulator [Candidatus Baltobacteraceae bacterium]
MQPNAAGFLQAGEFAEMAGVTVRTLHHYDELGLLRPAAKTEAGYRLYTLDDLARLTQINVLRFIGMPLKNIQEVLEGDVLELASALRMQRTIMMRKRGQIDAALAAIERAQATVSRDVSAKWVALREVIETMKEQQDWQWVKQHYTPEQLERLGKRYDPAMQETYSNQWAEIIAQAQRLKNEDPASPQAQALAKRWSEMIHAFTKGEPDIEASLKEVYGDKESQPKGFANPIADEAGAFINKALEIYKANG